MILKSTFDNSFPRLEPSANYNSDFIDVPSDLEEDEEESVVVLDDMIHLVISDDGDKYLDIRWEALMNEVEQTKYADGEQKNNAERAFDELMRRFEARTNMMGLNNREVYVKALQKWLNARLMVEVADGGPLGEHDRTFLKLLAAEIDYGPSSSDVEIMNRLKKKKVASGGGD